MKIVFVLLFAVLGLGAAKSQGTSFSPNPVAAFVNDGTTWSASTNAAPYGLIGYTPLPVGLYCQASPGAAWSPCVFSNGGGGSTTASKVVTGSAANTDTAGTVILASGTTASPVVTFTGTYASNPVCTFFTQNTTTTQAAALGTIATQVSTTATSASVSTAPAANITLGYICVGRS